MAPSYSKRQDSPWLAGSWRKGDVLWWVGAAIAVPVISRGAWWLAEYGYNSVTPYQYHYRPGTITGWIADLLERHAIRRRKRAPIRVYMDGCFDMMHYGHANALRQAKALGDVLVVGLIPDSEILRCKGPPVMNEAERFTMVSSVKWVDEVLTDVPYDLTPKFLEELLTKHKIDYVIHGDDPCILPDGTDAYEHVKKMGRFRMIKRTEGVSSTDIVGRMLMCTRVNPRISEQNRSLAKQFSRGDRKLLDEAVPATVPDSDAGERAGAGGASPETSPAKDDRTGISRFMPTSRRIVQFSEGKVAPPGAKIVYIDGAFDLFHPGHVEILQLAKAQGDFLLAGLHGDEDITERRGTHLPLMDLHERSLSVLACSCVDEVVIGAPLEITADLINTFNISLVVRGSVSETGRANDGDRYSVPKAQNIFRELESPLEMTTANIIKRIVQNRQQYEARNAKKNKAEAAYYNNHKAYVQEG